MYRVAEIRMAMRMYPWTSLQAARVVHFFGYAPKVHFGDGGIDK